MTRQRAFTTAAHRRRANPIVWLIDDRPIKLKATVELLEMAPLVDALNQPDNTGRNDIVVAEESRARMVQILRFFVEDNSHDNFDAIAPDLDVKLMTELIGELVMEYTGQANPTQAPSSQDGSNTIGSSSVDGAPAEA